MSGGSQSFSYGVPCRDPDEPHRLRPIRFDPKHRWFFIERDAVEAYGRAMELMNIAIWTAEEYLRDVILDSA